MPCMCGDTMCPSCGPAQGYDPAFELVSEFIFATMTDDAPEAISQEWLTDFMARKLGNDPEIADAMLNAAKRWDREYQAKKHAEQSQRFAAFVKSRGNDNH